MSSVSAARSRPLVASVNTSATSTESRIRASGTGRDHEPHRADEGGLSAQPAVPLVPGARCEIG